MNEPQRGRLAGIDFGTVRVGLAVTDFEQRLASPYENYTRRGEAADESAKSLEARRFGSWLANVTGRPVEFFDERYTSSEAERMLLDMGLTKKRRKERLDKLAAQILLTAYLESQSRGAQPQALDD